MDECIGDFIKIGEIEVHCNISTSELKSLSIKERMGIHTVAEVVYRETDWDFIKRLSTHLGVPIYAANDYTGQGICVGLQEQDMKSAYFYPWMPEHGNLVYCMPEEENEIRLFVAAIYLCCN